MLFKEFPSFVELSKASMQSVASIIAPLGLAQTKAKNIILLSQKVVNDYQGILHPSIEELVKLPGIGNKCANVIISEGFKLPGFAVDTHVARITNRLGLVKTTDPLKIEQKMKEMLPQKLWSTMHHRFIFMGRYLCKAKNPLCFECPFINICQYQK